jgi:hypothetical protein
LLLFGELVYVHIDICDQPWDFQAYGGTWGKMSFLHFHGGYTDTKHPLMGKDEYST